MWRNHCRATHVSSAANIPPAMIPTPTTGSSWRTAATQRTTMTTASMVGSSTLMNRIDRAVDRAVDLAVSRWTPLTPRNDAMVKGCPAVDMPSP